MKSISRVSLMVAKKTQVANVEEVVRWKEGLQNKSFWDLYIKPQVLWGPWL